MHPKITAESPSEEDSQHLPFLWIAYGKEETVYDTNASVRDWEGHGFLQLYCGRSSATFAPIITFT